MDIFVETLENMIENQKHDVWWENVVYERTKVQDIKVDDIKGMFCAEVDYIEDYQRILEYVKSCEKL